jgi:hypothetical protein
LNVFFIRTFLLAKNRVASIKPEQALNEFYAPSLTVAGIGFHMASDESLGVGNQADSDTSIPKIQSGQQYGFSNSH